MNDYIGDFVVGSTIRRFFNTTTSTGVPITLAGTPVVSVYAGNSTTEITTGVTLTPDFDGRTGLHLISIITTTGYTAGNDYELVLTAGTVDGNSVVGRSVGKFSLQNRFSGAKVDASNSSLGEFSTTGAVHLYFSTKTGNGLPITLAGTPKIVVHGPISASSFADPATYGITLEVDYASSPGFHRVTIAIGDASFFYTEGDLFTVSLAQGTVNGINVSSIPLGSFKVKAADASGSELTHGFLWDASTGSSVEVYDLPTGNNYLNQRLYHYVSGEARKITSQSINGSNYIFGFTTPFTALAINDKVSPVP